MRLNWDSTYALKKVSRIMLTYINVIQMGLFHLPRRNWMRPSLLLFSTISMAYSPWVNNNWMLQQIRVKIWYNRAVFPILTFKIISNPNFRNNMTNFKHSLSTIPILVTRIKPLQCSILMIQERKRRLPVLIPPVPRLINKKSGC